MSQANRRAQLLDPAQGAPIGGDWGFAVVDLLMQEMPGWRKALWLIAIVFIPIFGALIYLVVRPDPIHHVKEGLEAGRERYESSVGARSDLMDQDREPRV